MKIVPKVVLVGVLVVTTVMSAVGYLILTKTRDSMLGAMNTQLQGHAVFARSRILEQQAQIIRIAQTVARNRFISKALHLYESRGINQILNDFPSIYPFINYIIITEPDGSIFAASTRDRNRRKINGEQLLMLGLGANPMRTPPELTGVALGTPGLDAYLPIIGLLRGITQWVSAPILKRGKTIGRVTLSIDWEFIQAEVLEAVVKELVITGNPITAALLTDQAGTILVSHENTNTDQLSFGTGQIFHGDHKNLLWRNIEVKFGRKKNKVFVIYERSRVLQSLQEMTWFIIFSTVITGFLLGGLLYGLLRLGLLKRIESLHRGTEVFGTGDITHQIPDLGQDEIGSLGRAINAMIANLERTTTSRDKLDIEVEQRKQSEHALREAIAEAEIANRAKSEFLANMSHEIRTPMNGVIGMTNLMLDNPLTPDQHDRGCTIKRSAESLLAIINDILDFSKVEAGQLGLEIIDFNLSDLIADFANTLSFAAEEKGVELICPANPITQGWFKGDPGRIRQILTNLTGNAIKFTHHGEVAIYCTLEAGTETRSLLHFVIKDTGIGLSDEQQSRLFQRFSQADGSTTRQYGGTGLGLAISKQLVELMGGKIGVESSVGVGSTFSFTLALEGTEAQTTPSLSGDLHQQHILVVDDNATNRQLLAQLLDQWQAPHQLVADADAALILLRQAVQDNHPYSIALLDMQMPGMDGEQLGALIQADATLASTRLVLLTSQGRRGDAKKMQASGFMGYLSKPIQQSELYNALLQVAGVGNNTQLVTRYTAHTIPQYVARVLVVEDNITNQKVACGMLEKFGVSVDLVGDGREALNALKQLPYDLVFMDCHMPVMDGYEATRLIRDEQTRVKNHAIPIIAMTANAMQGDRDICITAGMDDHLAKPVDPTRLEKALKLWLPERCHQERFPPETSTPLEEPALLEVVFDYQALYTRMMEDDNLVQAVVAAFLEDMPQQLAQLEYHIELDDVVQAGALAHKMKGAALNVGGLLFSTQAASMEQAGKHGDMPTVRQTLPQLQACFTQLKTEMEELR